MSGQQVSIILAGVAAGLSFVTVSVGQEEDREAASNAVYNVVPMERQWDDYNRWGFSSGYISVPQARVLKDRAGWMARQHPSHPRRSSLAILAQPIDTEHAMLAGANVGTLCISDFGSPGVSDALCSEVMGNVGKDLVGFNFRLCQFDPDCLHATAAAVIATGQPISPDVFSFGTLAGISAWNMSSLTGPMRQDANGQIWPEAFLQDLDLNVFPQFPYIIEEPEDLGFLSSYDDLGSDRETIVAGLRELPDARALEARATLLPLLRDDASVDPIRRDQLLSEATSFLERVDLELPSPLQIADVSYDAPIANIATRVRDFRESMRRLPSRDDPDVLADLCISLLSRAKSLLYDLMWLPAGSGLAKVNSGSVAALAEQASALRDRLADAVGLSDKHDILSLVLNQGPGEEYLTLPKYAYPLVGVYPLDEGEAHKGPQPIFINEGMVLQHGSRPGGPIVAINVASRVEDPELCQDMGRHAPCLLVSFEAQARALEYLLRRAGGKTDTPFDTVGAVLLNAQGELVDKSCDDAPLAEVIENLRREGIYTFVAVGNDGDPGRVRYPACVSAAVSVGALGRDGKPMVESNGSRSKLVDLYIDGDPVVLPMRAPSPRALPGCLGEEYYVRTITGLQSRLANAGYYEGDVNGLLGSQTRAALSAFQHDTGLRPTGFFDDTSMLALAAQRGLGSAHEAYKYNLNGVENLVFSAARSVHWSNLDRFEDYSQLLCAEEAYGDSRYHVYLAGGTLVSAAAAAGAFLDMRESYPDLSPHYILNAMIRPSDRTGNSGSLWSAEEFRALDEDLAGLAR